MLAIGETGMQNGLETVGDGEHQDNGEMSDVANDIIMALLLTQALRI